MDNEARYGRACGKNGYLIIDSAAIRENYEALQAHVGKDVGIIPVIKGNCYGYGWREMTDVLINGCHAQTLAVGALCEGMELRARGVKQDIMLIGGIYPQLFGMAVENGIMMPLFDESCARSIEHAAASRNMTALVQLKIETGMNRLGVRPGEPLERLLKSLKTLPHIEVMGVYTHFATATRQADDPFCAAQHERFMPALDQVKNAGLCPRYVHCCNSAAALWFDRAYHTHVRLGASLYGNAVMEDGSEPVAIKPALTLRAFITNIHDMPAGESLGYAQSFVCERPLRVATMSLGFADGILPQYARRHGPVLVNGRRARLLEICMDQTMLDVTGIPCELGDEVTLIGSDGGECVSMREAEEITGVTFEYMTSFFGARIARVVV